MATSVNIGDDLKSYLSSSQAKTNPVSKFFGNGTSKVGGWFYSPLPTGEADEDGASGQANGRPQSSYFGSWFKRAEPEPDNSCLPSLVC